MNPELHVTSLEISKKLFELGVKQESVWGLHWVLNEYSNVNGKESFNTMMLTHDVIGSRSDCKYKAFLASEIMQLLPDRIIIPGREPFECFRFDLRRSVVVQDTMYPVPTFIVNYYCDTYETQGKSAFVDRTLFHNMWDVLLPDALAKAYIYIKENKLDENYYVSNFMEDKKND